MKKFVNEPGAVVREALAGIAAAHPHLRVDLDSQLVVRGDAPVAGKVALVSGGGSGHEPLHAGFVGPGMLDAACPGAIFTSPVPDQILAATQAVDGGAGVLHVVKNYTGDVLNFQLAAELAGDDGIEVATVLVDDDVAVEDSTYTAGRRGTGATLIVEKAAGALAAEGATLAEVAALGSRVNERSASFAVALRGATVPGADRPGFVLADGEMEIGIGIHGEPGRRRGPVVPAGEVVALMLDAILGAKPLPAHAPAIVLVNGLGGTPLIELYLLFGEVSRQLAGRDVRIARSLVGNYVTSLDMQGASLTVCHADEEILRLWDAPVRTPALSWG